MLIKVRGIVYALILLSLAMSTSVMAQEKKVPKTNTIDQYSTVNKKKEGPKVKKPLNILKTDTKGILYGNLCFEEFTRSKGYTYVIQPKGDPSFKGSMKRGFHNFGVKFVILLKNGIFWKLVERKRIKDCRMKTGDRIG